MDLEKFALFLKTFCDEISEINTKNDQHTFINIQLMIRKANRIKISEALLDQWTNSYMEEN